MSTDATAGLLVERVVQETLEDGVDVAQVVVFVAAEDLVADAKMTPLLRGTNSAKLIMP